jgi:TusE/DsrC/DsvC family sulfur relay protein
MKKLKKNSLIKTIKIKKQIMETTIAGKSIAVNEEGYLTNFSQWDEKVGEELAEQANIHLTPRHWEVIKYLQKEQQNQVALSIRRVGKSGVVDIKEFYQLFPIAPLKTATKIAGIPKPASCI